MTANVGRWETVASRSKKKESPLKISRWRNRRVCRYFRLCHHHHLFFHPLYPPLPPLPLTLKPFPNPLPTVQAGAAAVLKSSLELHFVKSYFPRGPSLVTKTASEKKRVAAMEQMPKLEDLVVLQPMKETQTMFGAFANVKENGTRKIKAAPNQGQGDDG